MFPPQALLAPTSTSLSTPLSTPLPTLHRYWHSHRQRLRHRSRPPQSTLDKHQCCVLRPPVTDSVLVTATPCDHEHTTVYCTIAPSHSLASATSKTSRHAVAFHNTPLRRFTQERAATTAQQQQVQPSPRRYRPGSNDCRASGDSSRCDLRDRP